MYTHREDYNLRPETIELFRSFIRHDLANRYFDRFLRMNELAVRTKDTFDLTDPIQSLQLVAESVCTHLGWETCSILIVDPSSKAELYLRAIAPLTVKSNKLLDQAYSLLQQSMTAQVFRSQQMVWSYDIAADPRNTHHLDDPTASPPMDWIGIPIRTPSDDVLGVLRVKNKKRDPSRVESHFCSFDMDNLITLAAYVAHFLHQCDMYNERRKLADQREQELQDLRDFLRTFRHEIRSPIQSVCFAPDRLGLILRTEGLIAESRVPKPLLDYLVDFKAVGARMEMISKALTLDPEEIVKHIAMNNLYKDCIAPVLAFATTLAQNRGRKLVVDKDSLLLNMECDPLAISMAVHVLVDNAIKYSDKNTVIRVFGERVKGGHAVIVENRSRVFKISQEERQQIFDKYTRGRTSRQQKMEGAGIGLYLARRIMELHGGELQLRRHHSPFQFALVLKN